MPETEDRLTELTAQLEAMVRRLSNPPSRFMGVEAAGVYSGLSADTVRRLVESGKLTGLRPVRGRILIDRLELERFILSATTRPRHSRGQSRRGASE